MNERIQKLYDQADKFAKENRTQTISGPGNNYFELFHEKFAEMIVRECAEICLEMSAKCAGLEGDGALAKDCAYWIKKDFGVEE